MSRQKRIRLIIVVLAVLAGVIFVVDFTRHNQSKMAQSTDGTTSLPGVITLYQDGRMVSQISSSSLESLEKYSFEDAEEGKRQNGPLLREVILLYVDDSDLSDNTQITVKSTEREKSVVLTWAQVANPENHVLFDSSTNRGTLKLVSSQLENLDSRDEWIQDTDVIEIEAP
jgi:hypothetical protein